MLRRLIPWVVLLLAARPWCRYTVREVGFVDLGRDAYVLHLAIADEQREAWRAAAAGLFLDSNVQVAWADPASADAAPSGWLEAPDGRTAGLALTDSPERGPLRSVVNSPLRERVRPHLTEAFAVVVLLHGGEAEAVDRGRVAVEAAVEDFQDWKDRLDKPVDIDPIVLELTVPEQEAEAFALFGLGLEEPLAGPAVAILYGRAQRVGPLLRGADLNRASVLAALTTVGRSCECDLDRRWMLGARLPMVWDDECRRAAVAHLGFDADNPMVKAEIARILARSGTNEASAPEASIDELLLGYSEVLVVDPRAAPPDAGEVTPIAPGDPSTEPLAQTHTPAIPDGASTEARHGDSAAEEIADESPGIAFGTWLMALAAGLCVVSLVGGLIVRSTQGRAH